MADLALGLKLFLDFAAAVGAVGEADRAALARRGWEALRQAAAAQAEHVQAAEPTALFLRLLAGAVGTTAYVAGPDPADGASLIRRHLVNRLSDHQLPHHLFVLDALPRTVDGGYDLGALPLPDASSRLDSYVPPGTTMERQLVGILHELLDVDRIGIHDSFFELGGFSLLATRLSARVRDVFQVEISLRDLFASASVGQLAQLIVQAQAQLVGMTDLEGLLDELTP